MEEVDLDCFCSGKKGCYAIHRVLLERTMKQGIAVDVSKLGDRD